MSKTPMMAAASSAGCATSSDREAIERFLGRPPASDVRVVVRCHAGAPAVIENAPTDAAGRPFPTRYWLVCPELAAAVSRVEAAGGVKALEADPQARGALVLAHRRHRALTGRGVGGNASLVRAKCLHAHLAFALAEGGNAVGEWIAARVRIDPGHDCCLGAICP